MQIKTGVDLVHIPKFKKFLESPAAVAKVFSSKELQRDSAERLASAFAIKEAFFKALGMNPKFLDVEVSPERGKPSLTYVGDYGIASLDVSVSHEQEYAIASVVMLIEGDVHE